MRKGSMKFVLTAMAFAFMATTSVSFAGETDILLQKLVEKGVLTAGEAQEIATETKEQVRQQNAAGKNEMIPSWVQTVKVKGDLRTRYEHRRDKGTAGDLSRARLRVRTGLEAKVNDQTKVGIGIATGKGSDPRSRNVTLGNDNTSSAADNTPASAKNIVLDYAFAQYTPFTFATITAGKFHNPLWQPIDVFWKGDITPEGFALNLNKNVNSSIQLFMNNLAFFIRNNDATDSKRPMLFAVQPGVNLNLTDKIALKTAGTYYKFSQMQNQPKFSYSSSTNSLFANNTYKYDYDSLQASAELGFKEVFAVPYFAIFGDYMYNISSNHPQTGRGGFDGGLKFGYEKVAGLGQWQAKAVYSKVGRDAWVDAFTDSDRYSGKTNTNAYEGVFEFGLGKNSSISLDYYYATLLTKSSTNKNTPEQLVQLDWVVKF